MAARRIGVGEPVSTEAVEQYQGRQDVGFLYSLDVGCDSGGHHTVSTCRGLCFLAPSWFALSPLFVTWRLSCRLRKYASPTMPLIPQLVTAAAWITSIGIVALVPIDVWSTLHGTSRASVAVIWEIAYWWGSLISAVSWPPDADTLAVQRNSQLVLVVMVAPKVVMRTEAAALSAPGFETADQGKLLPSASAYDKRSRGNYPGGKTRLLMTSCMPLQDHTGFDLVYHSGCARLL